MEITFPDNFQIEPRQATILLAAFEAFRLYGYKRVSMEDIARGAGMSRAALYQYYRNKQDIFRSILTVYFEMAVAGLRAALEGAPDLETAFTRAFEAQGGEIMEALLSSPHGDEFIDEKASSAADVVEDGKAAMAVMMGDWLARMVADGKADAEAVGDPLACARTMLDALHAQKRPGVAYADALAAMRRLALLFARGLAPKG
ncbi:TetR/AcrR family transcriptional regulator [Mesobacterium pallidum]|uniref:TetR/AcrR family transcriptional regulator n=1 Tax=Mesobacterium pallidum TaxID=2872037 RepID=UPI001EE33E5B|nr:TetR/AcrR family transcriptional regulator [Mesobacterium pallidum]